MSSTHVAEREHGGVEHEVEDARLAHVDAVEVLEVGAPEAVHAREPALGGRAVDVLDDHRLARARLDGAVEEDVQRRAGRRAGPRPRRGRGSRPRRPARRPAISVSSSRRRAWSGSSSSAVSPGGRAPGDGHRGEPGEQAAAGAAALAAGVRLGVVEQLRHRRAAEEGHAEPLGDGRRDPAPAGAVGRGDRHQRHRARRPQHACAGARRATSAPRASTVITAAIGTALVGARRADDRRRPRRRPGTGSRRAARTRSPPPPRGRRARAPSRWAARRTGSSR